MEVKILKNKTEMSKAAAAYVATIIAGAILCGCLVNAVMAAAPAAMETACCAHRDLGPVHWISAAFLAAMMGYNLLRPVGMGHVKPCSCADGDDDDS